jgi:hypothetical protein
MAPTSSTMRRSSAPARCSARPARTSTSTTASSGAGAPSYSLPRQRREVDRLSLQLVSLREVVDDILGLAHELAGSTIEAILAKSDLEVGLEALFGGQILHPRGPRASTRSGAASPGGEAGLALPPGVSLAAIPEPGVLGWVIRHSHPGEVGRIVLSDVAGGDSKMQAEVVGPDGDPAFGLRRRVVEDVVGSLKRILDGVGPA